MHLRCHISISHFLLHSLNLKSNSKFKPSSSLSLSTLSIRSASQLILLPYRAIFPSRVSRSESSSIRFQTPDPQILSNASRFSLCLSFFLFFSRCW
ncbi:hypothetical protein Hdeb2414_s0008g00284181 [Helianthus debilis subsp. tardiflorus]